jgi:hypothetical protein
MKLTITSQLLTIAHSFSLNRKVIADADQTNREESERERSHRRTPFTEVVSKPVHDQ